MFLKNLIDTVNIITVMGVIMGVYNLKSNDRQSNKNKVFQFFFHFWPIIFYEKNEPVIILWKHLIGTISLNLFMNLYQMLLFGHKNN